MRNGDPFYWVHFLSYDICIGQDDYILVGNYKVLEKKIVQIEMLLKYTHTTSNRQQGN